MKQKTLDKIFLFLRKRGNSTVGQVALGCDLSYNTTKKYLKHLCDTNWALYKETEYRPRFMVKVYRPNDEIPF